MSKSKPSSNQESINSSVSSPKDPEGLIGSRVVKAMSHPLRIRILAQLEKQESSPSRLAAELDAPLGNVSYHVRILASLNVIKLTNTTYRRGSVEHHYALVDGPLSVSDETWSIIPDGVKRTIIGGKLEQIGTDIRSSAKADGFSRPETHISRTELWLDAEGWKEIAEIYRKCLRQIDQVEKDSAKRIGQSGDKGQLAIALMMAFEAGQEES